MTEGVFQGALLKARAQRRTSEPMAESQGRSKRVQLALMTAGLIALVAGIYGQTARFEFVDYDDTQYVFKNPNVNRGLTGEGVRYAFTDTRLANWHPVTFLSHQLDCELFPPRTLGDAGPHHVVNAGLHAGNSILVLLVLYVMTGSVWRSGFVAGMFAAHPLHVESVAWVAERKDVLSALFALLALLAYGWYVRRRSVARYVVIVAAFGLSLMSKAMFVTLPFAMLLLDFWPLRRCGRREAGGEVKVKAGTSRRGAESAAKTGGSAGERRRAGEPRMCVAEKLPLLAMSAVISVVAMKTQGGAGAAPTIDDLPWLTRVSSAIVGYCTYLRQAVWPADLCVFYPYEGNWPAGQLWICGGVIIGLTVFAAVIARRVPAVLVGWCWFAGTLVPVIGLVQIGSQAHADRYMYVPLVGLLIGVAWGAGAAAERWGTWSRVIAAVAGAMCILGAAILAWKQTGYWKNSRALYERALAVTEENHIIQNNLGLIEQREGLLAEAMARFEEAARIKPGYAEAWCSMAINDVLAGRSAISAGRTEEARGKFREAVSGARRAIELDGEFAEAHSTLGEALYHLGDAGGAERAFEEAIRHDETFGPAIINLGLIRMGQGRFAEAVEQYERGIESGNDEAMTYFNLGLGYMSLRDCERAAEAFERCVARDERIIDAHIQMAAALLNCGRHEEAMKRVDIALSKDPSNPNARMIKQAIEREQREEAEGADAK